MNDSYFALSVSLVCEMQSLSGFDLICVALAGLFVFCMAVLCRILFTYCARSRKGQFSGHGRLSCTPLTS